MQQKKSKSAANGWRTPRAKRGKDIANTLKTSCQRSNDKKKTSEFAMHGPEKHVHDNIESQNKRLH